VFYHYESEAAGRLIESKGYRIARRGECFDLSCPLDEDGVVVAPQQIHVIPGGNA
jgi:hypothetical protein